MFANLIGVRREMWGRDAGQGSRVRLISREMRDVMTGNFLGLMKGGRNVE